VSTPIQGGRPLLRTRILGFPVHLDLSFVLIMAIFGYFPGTTVTRMVIWLLITPLAVLVHELGHAVVARSAGAAPEIALAGFGGVTTFSTPRPLSRLRSLSISLAGPMVGLAVGIVLLLVGRQVAPSLEAGGWQDIALTYGIWTCIGWSVLNLLPVLPLDGGQAMRELLPGSPAVRTRRAAMVSVVVAAAVAVAAYLWLQQPFVALFMLFFAVNNAMSLRRPSAPSGSASAQTAQSAQLAQTPEQAVVALLWNSQPAQARQLLSSMPPDTTVDLAVHGAVLALTGDRAQGHALLAQEVQRRPADPNAAALLLLTLTLEHDWDAVFAALAGPTGAVVPASVIERAVQEARGTGREDVAGRLTVLAAQPRG